MAEPDVRDVTLGEVYRLVTKVDGRLDTITQQMVGRAEYESDQEGIERRFVMSEAQAAATAADVSKLRADVTKTEKDRDREAGQRRFTMLGLIASPIVGAIMAWIVAGGLSR